MVVKISKASRELGVKCPKCGGREIWRCGFYPYVSGRRLRFKCTVCAHSFNEGVPGSVVGGKRPKTVAPSPVGKVKSTKSEPKSKPKPAPAPAVMKPSAPDSCKEFAP